MTLTFSPLINILIWEFISLENYYRFFLAQSLQGMYSCKLFSSILTVQFLNLDVQLVTTDRFVLRNAPFHGSDMDVCLPVTAERSFVITLKDVRIPVRRIKNYRCTHVFVHAIKNIYKLYKFCLQSKFLSNKM